MRDRTTRGDGGLGTPVDERSMLVFELLVAGVGLAACVLLSLMR